MPNFSSILTFGEFEGILVPRPIRSMGVWIHAPLKAVEWSSIPPRTGNIGQLLM